MSFLSQPLSLITIKPVRSIAGITAYVTINESTNDTMTITKQPVQQGASITDHAYKEPTAFVTSILFRDNLASSLSEIYADLLELQSAREPLEIVTPKRIYKNMLISVLSQTTDKNTENCLAINISFQEVIIVKVTTVQVPRTKQRNPGSTGATENAGRKSALSILFGGG